MSIANIVIPIGVAVAGKFLNDTKQPRTSLFTRNNSNDINSNLIPSGDGLRPYNVQRYDKIDLETRRMAENNYIKGEDPKNTGMIPSFYNQFYNEQGDPRIPTDSNFKSILPTSEIITKEQMRINNKKVFSGPMFNSNNFNQNENMYEQFDPIRIRKTVYDQNNNDGMIGDLDLDSYSELTGLPSDYRHNNMVPYFGSKITQNMDEYATQSTLERYTGMGDIPNRKKEELGPMFQVQQENIFGTQSLPEDLRKDRFYQSNLKTNILPVPQVRVTPLDELQFRPYSKNVDELRVKTNPKISYQGRTQAPPQGTAQRGIQASVNKNRPDKTFYIGNDHLGPSKYSGPTQVRMETQDNYIPAWKCTNRQDQHEEYYGTAASSIKAPKIGMKRQKLKSQIKNRTKKYRRNKNTPEFSFPGSIEHLSTKY